MQELIGGESIKVGVMQQKRIEEKSSLDEVPRFQKRKIPKSLEYYKTKYKDEKNAIVKAYLSGGYTLKDIGDYYGKHYSTISRIVKAHELSCGMERPVMLLTPNAP